MVSTTLAISSLVAMLVVAQAAPSMNSFGGQQQQGGFGGQQNGFRSGFGNQGSRSGGQGGQMMPMPQGAPMMPQGGPMMPVQGGPGGNGMGMGASNFFCKAPECYTPQTTNDTINSINALWVGYVAGSNCSSILDQEEAIVKTATDQYVSMKAANLTGPAQSVFNQFKAAYAAFDASTDAVQTELLNFEVQLLLEGGPGPSQECFMNRRGGK